MVGEEKFSLFLRKILTLGVAYCTLCLQEANCSSRGRAALEDHVRTAKPQEHTQSRPSAEKTKQLHILLLHSKAQRDSVGNGFVDRF